MVNNQITVKINKYFGENGSMAVLGASKNGNYRVIDGKLERPIKGKTQRQGVKWDKKTLPKFISCCIDYY